MFAYLVIYLAFNVRIRQLLAQSVIQLFIFLNQLAVHTAQLKDIFKIM